LTFCSRAWSSAGIRDLAGQLIPTQPGACHLECVRLFHIPIAGVKIPRCGQAGGVSVHLEPSVFRGSGWVDEQYRAGPSRGVCTAVGPYNDRDLLKLSTLHSPSSEQCLSNPGKSFSPRPAPGPLNMANSGPPVIP